LLRIHDNSRTLRVLATLAFAATVAHGTTILFDSTAGTPSGTSGSQIPTYGSFSTGVATGNLSGLQLVMESSNPSDGLSLRVGLYSDNSTSPGSLITFLGTIADSALTSSPTLVNVSLSATPSLLANTRYWIGLSVVTFNPITTSWVFESPDSGTGVAGEYYDTTGLTANNSFSSALMMQVAEDTVIAAPEPGSILLVAGGLCGLGVALRRRSIATRARNSTGSE